MFPCKTNLRNTLVVKVEKQVKLGHKNKVDNNNHNNDNYKDNKDDND